MVFKWVYLCLIALSHPRLMAPLGDHQPLSLSPFLGWIVTDQLSSGQLWWMNRSCIGWHSILKPIGASVFGSSDNGFNRWAWGLKGWSEKVGGESWLSISYKSSFSGHPFFLESFWIWPIQYFPCHTHHCSWKDPIFEPGAGASHAARTANPCSLCDNAACCQI